MSPTTLLEPRVTLRTVEEFADWWTNEGGSELCKGGPILFDESKRFEFIMTEAAVRWRLGPLSLMRAQVDRIITVGALENVTVGIIPQATEADVWHDHEFNIADDRGDNGDPVVHFETLTEGVTVTKPDEVAAFKDAFTRLRQLAVTGDEAEALLRRIGLS